MLWTCMRTKRHRIQKHLLPASLRSRDRKLKKEKEKQQRKEKTICINHCHVVLGQALENRAPAQQRLMHGWSFRRFHEYLCKVVEAIVMQFPLYRIEYRTISERFVQGFLGDRNALAVKLTS